MPLLIWPLWQRVLHAVLALSVLSAIATFEGGPWHEGAGYVALVAALLRLALGLIGPTAARFTSFLHGPHDTALYAWQLMRGNEPRHLNHNPLGAWMVLVLLLLAAAAGISGALYVTDRYWGFAWVIALHAALAWPLLPLIALHLAGVWHASRRHHDKLVTAMWWHGRKRGPRDMPP